MNTKKLLTTILFCAAGLLCFNTTGNAQTWVQKGLDIDGEAADNYSGTSVSMPDAYTVAIGAPDNSGNSTNSGHVRVYRWNGMAWVQKGLDIDGTTAGGHSGSSVSMPDSNTVAIGAPFVSNTGRVQVYRWNGAAWVQKGLDIDGIAGGDYSGNAVSMPDSNTVAIGARESNNSTGRVRMYRWNGSAWVQKGIDINGDAIQDRLGSAVSMPDSNTVAVTAPANDGNGFNAGQARVYRWNGTAWVQKGSEFDGQAAYNQLGTGVSMPDSNTVAIGASGYAGNTGQVLVYRWNGSVWVQKGAGIDGEATSDFSGGSVSMPDSNTVAVTAQTNDGNGSNAGHVRVYRWNGSAWVQLSVDIDGEAANDHSGSSVSMPDSNTVAIGAMNNDGSGADAGHVRVYNFCAAVTAGVISCSAPNNMICANSPVLFSTTSSDSIDWYWQPDGQGPFQYVGSGSTLDPGQPGNNDTGLYVLMVIAPSPFCTPDTSALLSVYVVLSPEVMLGSDTTVCPGSLLLNAGNAGSAYLWSTGDTTQTVSPAASGTYNVQVTNTNGCVSSDTIAVTILNGPTVTATASSTLACFDDGNVNLSGTPAGGTFTGPGVTGTSFDPSVAGNGAQAVVYSFTDVNGCTGTSTVTITVSPCVGVADAGLEQALRVFPNPTGGNLAIGLGSVYSNVVVSVKNTLGQQVSNESFTSTNKIQFAIAGEAGVYFIEVNADGKRAILKVVKE